MAAMVREFPRVPAMALLTETQYTTPQILLSLGQMGVGGFSSMRRQPLGGKHFVKFLLLNDRMIYSGRLLGHFQCGPLPAAPPDCWRFFEFFSATTPRVHSVRQAARQ